LRDARAVKPLGSRLVLVVEHDDTVVTEIISALGEIGGESAREYLTKVTNEGNSLVSDRAKAALGDKTK